MTKPCGTERFQLPRWEDLPTIDLYLDQVLSLIDSWLDAYLGGDEKRVMTKTMVNNYVKQKFIPAPVKKKYDRLAVASLFVIAVLKPVYTMEEISRLIQLALERSSQEEAYDHFCDLVESAVDHAFAGTTMERVRLEDDPRLILWNACNAFACQLYVRRIYLLDLEAEKDRSEDRSKKVPDRN